MNALIKTFLTACLLLTAFALKASAAEVHSGISTRETYVGLPVTFQVQISNATNFDPPTVPEIPGLRIESAAQPSRSTQTTIINGNISTRSSVTYSYAVTPLGPGNYRIPPISVRVDGQTLETRPFEFVASKSETGDLLFVEVAGKEKQIYVGQALDITLKIWVRPYYNKEHGITLSEADMWQLIAERTHWGPFAERIEQFAANNQRPVGTEVLRKDRDGANHSYFLYELDATIYPKKPGRIDANDVQVIALYPTALGQSRSPFGGMLEEMGFPDRDDMFAGGFPPFGPRLTIESVRPIVAEAKVEPIEVQEIPIADRPADYRGAVGQYRIVGEAKESNVKAGDPINLLIGIAGTGPMDLVQAPPLAELPELTADFKVPNEPLAGFVKGDRKVFSTNIRPRKEGITEIPAIPFSYFDPEADKFVTVHSQPIPIHVAPADTLALDAVIGRTTSAAGRADASLMTDAVETTPQLAIFTGNELLQNERLAKPLPQPLLLLAAVPPIVILGLFIARNRSGLAAIAGHIGSSSKRCQQHIKGTVEPSEVALALRTFFITRFALGGESADDAAVLGALRSNGHRNLAVRCERLLQQCEIQDSFRTADPATIHELKCEALKLVEELQSHRRPPQIKSKSTPAGTRSRWRSSTSSIISGIALAGTLLVTTGETLAQHNHSLTLTSAADVSLTAEQRQTLLAEANDRYELALQASTKDSAEAKQTFANAATKYQLLVDSGVQNSRLYFNLANAYLQSGASGRAIANYHRALRYDLSNLAARNNLLHAETLVNTFPDELAASDERKTLSGFVLVVNTWLNRYITPRGILAWMIFSWLTLWIAVGLRLYEICLPWKSLVAASFVVVMFTAGSYALSCQELTRKLAVIASPKLTLRTGDGKQFPSVLDIQLHEGQTVEPLKERGGWIQVRTATGDTGWLPDLSVEVI